MQMKISCTKLIKWPKYPQKLSTISKQHKKFLCNKSNRTKPQEMEIRTVDPLTIKRQLKYNNQASQIMDHPVEISLNDAKYVRRGKTMRRVSPKRKIDVNKHWWPACHLNTINLHVLQSIRIPSRNKVHKYPTLGQIYQWGLIITLITELETT